MDRHKYEKENEALNDRFATMDDPYCYVFEPDCIDKKSFEAVISKIKRENIQRKKRIK